MEALDADRLVAGISAAADANRFSGVVSLRVGSELIFERAYGYADRANQIVNTTRTRFGTASATKTFTALCICALIEDGRLALSTSVTDVLSAALPHVSREVTIESLLTHTSGIGDYYDEDLVDDFTAYHLPIPWYRLERTSDYLPLIADLPPKFRPGDRFSYSNSGFILLGLVAEELAGTSYQQCVQTQIFDRAGMSDSGFFRLDALPNSTALGYIDADGSWRTNVYNLPVIGGADGGAFSTAPDIARFWSALDDDLIVGRESRELFLRPHASAPTPGFFYGLGVWIYQCPGGRPFHVMEGADAGVTFTSLRGPENEVGYTVACNAPPSAAEILKLLDEAILAVDPG